MYIAEHKSISSISVDMYTVQHKSISVDMYIVQHNSIRLAGPE